MPNGNRSYLKRIKSIRRIRNTLGLWKRVPCLTRVGILSSLQILQSKKSLRTLLKRCRMMHIGEKRNRRDWSLTKDKKRKQKFQITLNLRQILHQIGNGSHSLERRNLEWELMTIPSGVQRINLKSWTFQPLTILLLREKRDNLLRRMLKKKIERAPCRFLIGFTKRIFILLMDRASLKEEWRRRRDLLLPSEPLPDLQSSRARKRSLKER